VLCAGSSSVLGLAQAETYCTVADAELLGNLPNTCTVCPQPPHLIVIHSPAWTAKLFAAGSRVSDSGTHALADQIALKLSDSRNNGEQRLAPVGC
jgi:hypothetical protein